MSRHSAHTPHPTFVLVGRDGCHLCDGMESLLARVLDPLGIAWSKVDVDADPDLARFSEVVPVLLRDGRAVAKVHLDEQALRRLLARRR